MPAKKYLPKALLAGGMLLLGLAFFGSGRREVVVWLFVIGGLVLAAVGGFLYALPSDRRRIYVASWVLVVPGLLGSFLPIHFWSDVSVPLALGVGGIGIGLLTVAMTVQTLLNQTDGARNPLAQLRSGDPDAVYVLIRSLLLVIVFVGTGFVAALDRRPWMLAVVGGTVFGYLVLRIWYSQYDDGPGLASKAEGKTAGEGP